MTQDNVLVEERYKLLGSLLEFTRIFYYLRTGRKFDLSEPEGRESHYLSICRELVSVIRGNTNRLIINVPPRYGKTELVINFVGWAMANYADSNFLYVSYSHSLAKKQTQTIKQIMELPHYRKLFDIQLSSETSAKDNFETTKGGSVYAAGAGGTITGRGAGVKGVDRFGGCVVIDDIHKPSEVTSDTIRQSVNEWYYNTLHSRLNGPNTPIIFIGQRLHEDDLASNLIQTGEWKTLIIPALDEAGNALHPEMHSKYALLQMKENSPYDFASQYQQDPQPAGGGIFKRDWFPILDEEPVIIETFLTVDTAETDKSYNDATVFSFWGLYKLTYNNIDIGLYGLHWIDCLEVRIEPKDLQNEFMNFYFECMQHKMKPKFVAIEKKSTGVTLLSSLANVQGLQTIEIKRTSASGDKTSRFLEMQPFVSSKKITFTKNAKHINLCIDHMAKITANNSHRWDDICDTAYDAVKLALIDKIFINRVEKSTQNNDIVKQLASSFRRKQRILSNR